MYTRQQICTLSEMDVERFKSLARRDQLPFVYDSVDARNDDVRDQHPASGGWRRFTQQEAVSLAVAEALNKQMGYADGLPLASACHIVSNSGFYIADAVAAGVSPASAADVWFGHTADALGCGTIGGDLASVTVHLLASMKSDRTPSRVFLVNVSAVLREMAQRASKADIEFAAA